MRIMIPTQGAGLEQAALGPPVAATRCQVIAPLFGRESSGQALRRIKGRRRERERRHGKIILLHLEPGSIVGGSSSARMGPLGPSLGNHVFTLKDLVSCLVLVIKPCLIETFR